MDKQVLDRLMLDRSLGALNADVEQLLKAYLAAVPDAAAVADGEQYARTVEAARQAMAARSKPAVPALKLHVPARYGLWRSAMAAAAALVIGVALGALGLGQRQAHGPQEANNPAPPAASQIVQLARADAADHFWSARRLSRQASGVQKMDTVNWTSPLRGQE